MVAPMNQITHGANSTCFDLVGHTVADVRTSFRDVLSVCDGTSAYLGGSRISDCYLLRPGDRIEFMREHGRKCNDKSDDAHPNDKKVPLFVPPGAPAWVTVALIGQTLDTWQPYYKERLTSDDAFEIIMNISRYWEVIREWERQ